MFEGFVKGSTSAMKAVLMFIASAWNYFYGEEDFSWQGDHYFNPEDNDLEGFLKGVALIFLITPVVLLPLTAVCLSLVLAIAAGTIALTIFPMGEIGLLEACTAHTPRKSSDDHALVEMAKSLQLENNLVPQDTKKILETMTAMKKVAHDPENKMNLSPKQLKKLDKKVDKFLKVVEKAEKKELKHHDSKHHEKKMPKALNHFFEKIKIKHSSMTGNEVRPGLSVKS